MAYNADGTFDPAHMQTKRAPEPSERAGLDVFDAYGKIRMDFTEAELESLTPERRQRWEALFAAALGERDAGQEMAAALAHVGAFTKAVNEAEQALASARPQTSFIDELRRSIRANSGVPIDPVEVRAEKKAAAEVAKKLAPLVEAVEAANTTLADARDRVNAARDDLRRKRAMIAKEVISWQAQFKPVTHESLGREAAARSQKRLLDLANGTISPPVKPRPASKLDGLMQSGGRGKSTRRLPSQP